MAYVKISDPSVIDLAAWHQVINVVNQHSDSITAITNNFGAAGTGVVDYSSSSYANEFSAGNQKILYGRAVAYHSVSGQTDTASSGKTLYGQVNFTDAVSGSASFASQPVVTAVVFSGSATTFSATNQDVSVNLYGVTKDGFYFRLYCTTTTNYPTGTIWINWTAIGPK